MKCCVEGCKNTPMGGSRFYRLSTGRDSPWACDEHYVEAKIEADVRSMHERHDNFFQKEQPK